MPDLIVSWQRRVEVGMLELRKLVAWREQVFAEMGHTAPVPVVRAVGLAVIANPYAGRRVADLSLLFGLGATIL